MNKVIFFLFLIWALVGCKEYDYQYYDSGKIRVKAEVKHGKKDGLLTEYFEDGSIKSTQAWKNGMLNGLVEDFYLSGKIESRGIFKASKMLEMISYFENGNVFEKYIIDSLGYVVDVERYRENGMRDSVAFPHAYISGGDSLKSNLNAVFICKMLNTVNPRFKNGQMIISNRLLSKPKGGVIGEDTIKIIHSVNGSNFEFEFRPQQTGPDTIYAQLIFDTTIGATIRRAVIDVTYPYYVIDN